MDNAERKQGPKVTSPVDLVELAKKPRKKKINVAIEPVSFFYR